MSKNKAKTKNNLQAKETEDNERSRRLFHDSVEKAGDAPAAKAEESVSTVRWVREVVETLAVALVLAFLFKTFEAEAFIIPTGSMAPTLMGKHKDVNCEQCAYRFRISASEEFDEGNNGETSRRLALIRDGKQSPPPPQIVAGTCPQCRYTMYLGEDKTANKEHPSYDGDRILVFKYFYDVLTPQRWSVTVFRYPGGPQTNFIKRLIGLENETVRIQNGDIFIRPEGEEEFKIARKPTKHLFPMLQTVNDNDYVNPKLHGETVRWPRSWADETDSFGAMLPADATLQKYWTPSEDLRSFECAGDSETTRWLHYRHINPSSEDWFYLAQNKRPPAGVRNNPQLITDFCAFNTGIVKYPVHAKETENAAYHLRIREMEIDGQTLSRSFCNANAAAMGFNWDGDFAVQCELHVPESKGTFTMRLVKGGVPFHCAIDLSNGEGAMFIGEEDAPFDAAMSFSTPLSKPGMYKLRYANIDEQLRLWVDGVEVPVEGNGEYDALCEEPRGPLARDRSPTALDLTPASLGSKGAKVRVEHLKVFRDIYYLAVNANFQGNCDLLQDGFFHQNASPESESKNASLLSDPMSWHIFGKTRVVEFTLEKDQFFTMGDNSAKSHDARLWRSMSGGGQYVPRSYMIGEAANVYWPHGLMIPGIKKPWFPNFKDMRFIN